MKTVLRGFFFCVLILSAQQSTFTNVSLLQRAASTTVL